MRVRCQGEGEGESTRVSKVERQQVIPKQGYGTHNGVEEGTRTCSVEQECRSLMDIYDTNTSKGMQMFPIDYI